MTTLVAGTAFDMNELILGGSLSDFFASGEPVNGTATTFTVANFSDAVVEQLTLTGSFANYDVDGYPTTGTITGLEYVIGGTTLFTITGASITVEAFKTYVSTDDLAGLFQAILAGPDMIAGSSSDDYLFGYDGNDVLDGNGGHDILEGGAGDDVINGMSGDDTLRGGTGADALHGGDGNDLLSEGAGDTGPYQNDTYDGGAGIDRVSMFTTYGPGVTIDLRITTAQNTISMGTDTFVDIEHITSNYGDDTLTGNDQANWFWTFSGTDTLSGLGGNDYFTVGAGDKIADGGSGIDTIEIADFAFQPVYTNAGITVSLALQGTAQAVGTGTWTLTNIENLGGFTGDDELTGDDNGNVLAGQLGNDTLVGSGGNDQLLGDGTFVMGNDGVQQLVEVDTIDGPGGNDVLDGGAGDDYLNGGGGSDMLTGGSGNDTFRGTAAELNTDSITDLQVGDRIIISDATLNGFTFSMNGPTLTYTGGSMTLNGTLNGTLVASAAAGGGVQLSLQPAPTVTPFAPESLVLTAFGYSAGGWTSDDGYPRRMSDVNGDGRADIVGFGNDGVFVALGNAGGSFDPSIVASLNFGHSAGAGGWTSDTVYPRLLADVNGDNRADVVAFGEGGTYVALGNADGTFGAAVVATGEFGRSTAAGGWSSNDIYHRELADVNGDGNADIVGFGNDGVYVALGQANGTFGASQVASVNFGYSAGAGGWTSDNVYPRRLADVNGDGHADVVGFGDGGTFVALGQANGTFGTAFLASGEFGAGAGAGGWASNDLFYRELADVNGDNRADIIGFGNSGTFVALGQADGTFGASAMVSPNFGSGPEAGGWGSQDTFPRHVADVNNDGFADIVGFGSAGVYVALSNGDYWV